MYSEYDIPCFNMNNATEERTLRDYVKDPKVILAVLLPILTLLSMIYFYVKTYDKTMKIEYVADIEHVRFYKIHHQNKTYLLATNQYAFQIVSAN